MRHFVAYHNTEKMGRALHDRGPLRLVTNKPARHLIQNVVWFIVGEGARPRKFYLGSVFLVDQVGEAEEESFQWFAAGPGHLFRPPVSLNERAWFPDLKKAVANFSLGVLEIRDEHFIDELLLLAAQAGHSFASRDTAPS